MMEPLPIDPYIPVIISTLKNGGSLVLSAAPGAGKTTRVPRALYDAGFAENGEILVLEPRRLAARLAAARVAGELGEKAGETVGYSIRFENVAGPRTRIRFLTEAILAHRIVHDPNLAGVSLVILDEFHERHLATDLSLALLKQLRLRKPDLKIVVMSATLDAGPITSFLADAQLLNVPGSLYDVEVEFEEKTSDRPLHEKIVSAVSKLSRSGTGGDILVFLPGAAEIRRSMEALESISERMGLLVYPLHGDLPAPEQSRAIEPSERQKIILATNVAETSITIPGIAAVIDSGLARVAGHSPWSGFPTIATANISRSAALQRAGRAGRTQAGKVIRLYTKADFESRPEFEVPEIRRIDLTETALLLHASGILDLKAFPWFESPSNTAIEAADTLLRRLQAIDREGGITAIGSRMLPLPVHPRLARLIIEGDRQGVRDESILLAALLSERDIRIGSRTAFGSSRTAHTGAASESDLLELLDAFQSAEERRFQSSHVSSIGLDPGAVHRVKRARDQLMRLVSKKQVPSNARFSGTEEEGLLISALAGFPDRVFRRRKPHSRELLMAGGGTATLAAASTVHNPMFGVAVDAEERRDPVRKVVGVTVRLASAVDVDWLAALFPDEISEKSELIWNEDGGRVDQFRAAMYGQITLEEQTIPASPSDEASAMLASVLISRRLPVFRNTDAIPILQARLSLLSKYFPDEKVPVFGEPEIQELVRNLCRGRTRISELEGVSLADAITAGLTERQKALLNRDAPERIKLKAGRAVKVHYETARPPWVESRLQDFFGMTETPSVCGRQVPLTIHLLAPNGRAVQVTTDLAGFWKKHYPSIRKELQRRYPKHAWPEIV